MFKKNYFQSFENFKANGGFSYNNIPTPNHKMNNIKFLENG